MINFETLVKNIKSNAGASAVVREDASKLPAIIVVSRADFLNVMKYLHSKEGGDFNVLQSMGAVDFLPEVKKPAPKAVPTSASEGEAPQPAQPVKEEKPVEVPGRIECVYHLWSYANDFDLAVKVELPREKPEIESVYSLWVGANWHEREAYDLFGVFFSGHPDLRRILCPVDWEGHALLKDYKVQETWRGIVVEPRSKMNPWLRNLQ